ncbi:MAG: large-conductance mechanosensitive channel protein MscL [Lentisphaerae bacterium]|nr:large-conductance mechanosensitive channel protein MscL [Lentisphaerota bacterium]
MSILSEFKEFAVKGNVVDMAVGIIIGGAFGKIVTSVVNDVIMPPIGLLLGGVNFTDLAITLKKAVMAADGVTVQTAAVMLNYGKCIQTIVDFLIVAWAVFLLVKALNSLRRKQEAIEKKA